MYGQWVFTQCQERRPSVCLPTWVRPVCFSFKSQMCIANLPDDLSLAGPASYLALLFPKSIGLWGSMLKPWESKLQTEVAQRVQVQIRVTCWLISCAAMLRACAGPTLTGLAQSRPVSGLRVSQKGFSLGLANVLALILINAASCRFTSQQHVTGVTVAWNRQYAQNTRIKANKMALNQYIYVL